MTREGEASSKKYIKPEHGAIFGFYRKSLLVLFIGLLGVAMLAATVIAREREFQNSLLNEVIMDLQRSATLFHLKVEEQIGAARAGSDASKGYDDALARHIREAKVAAQLLLDGGAAIGDRRIKPLADEAIRANVKVILEHLDDFEVMGMARVDKYRRTGAVDAEDAAICRAAYGDIMEKTIDVERVFHGEITGSYSKNVKLIVGMVAVWFGVTVFATLGLNVVEGRRKRAVHDLSMSESRYRLITSTSFDGILLSDGEKIVEANGAAERIFGYNGGELEGLGLVDLMPPEYRGDHLLGIKRFKETGEKRMHGKVVEAEGLKKSGEPFPIELLINSFSVDGDVYISATVRDISVRKNTEMEREKLIVDLREAVGKIKVLKGLIPICAYCKKIREDTGYWKKVETYVEEHTDAAFTHGICETCAKALKEEGEALLRERNNGKDSL